MLNPANYGQPFQKQRSVSGATTLSSIDLETLLSVDSTSGPVTITLPQANTINPGGAFCIIALRGATNPVMVEVQAGDTYNNGLTAPLSISGDGEAVTVYATSDNTWTIVTGGGGGGGGTTLNCVVVPWTTLSPGGTASTYYVALGTPTDLFGTAAADWTVAPGTPGSSSDIVSSATRTGIAWWAQSCLQCGPEGSVRRAFLSAFNPGPVGVTGCASGFEGNNDRAETTVFYGGLLPASGGLFFQLAWNGGTPLTLNSGQLLILST